MPVCDCVSGETNVRELQEKDDSINACLEMAEVGKGDYITDNGLLYHSDQVEGQTVCQLCVPSVKQNVVMQMAHNSVFGDYLAEEKTCKCIQLSLYFVWLLFCILSFCIFVSGSQLGWAIVETEAHTINWALSRFWGLCVAIRSLWYVITICWSMFESVLPEVPSWSLYLQEYDIDIKYTGGTRNVVADYLSRVLSLIVMGVSISNVCIFCLVPIMMLLSIVVRICIDYYLCCVSPILVTSSM